MKPEEFKARVAELADIEDYKVAQVNIRSKKQEDEGEIFPPGENPTLGFRIKKIKPTTRACELGCGKIVTNQVIETKLYTSPQMHWRTVCANCHCTVSPDGSGFIESSLHTQNAFTKYFKDIAKGKLPPT